MSNILDGQTKVTRRALTLSALMGGTSMALGLKHGAAGETGSPDALLNIRNCGAKGDGKTDDTKAIQNAIDAAAEKKSAVFVPPGLYMSSEIRLRPNVALLGVPSWDYKDGGGAILKLIDEQSTCLLNITDAWGCTLDGLSLEGDNRGQGIHGIFLNKPTYHREDAFRIERCQVAHFTGDGVNLTRAWCFSIRHSMIAFNKGDGVRLRGWDGFLMDNWFSGNVGAGFAAREENAAVTMTANRIEWNGEGILIVGGNNYNITGNYLDRSGKQAIVLLPGHNSYCKHMTITGNFIYRSGKDAVAETYDSSQIYMEGAKGITCIGNSFRMGRDDDGKGVRSPSYGIVYKELSNCVIANNVLHEAALKDLMVDLGEHGEGVIVKDNPGSLFNPVGAL